MSQRLNKFNGYAEHPWLCRVYKKLPKNLILLGEKFILENDHLNKEEFDFIVNRMFLDKPKPNGWEGLMELLSNCNV